ncbi:S26 family signal peptidase [Mesorhizobium sp. M0006]|uniref:S26 family signal peptidase n=1 Tax=Mesorhizobium sp. M0006 TaxID=2956838 RepID=UPI0033399F26
MRRSVIVLTVAVASAAVLGPVLTAMPARFVWNASASAPIGLYRIADGGPFLTNDLVAVKLPEPLATFLADRAYLPKGVLLLKRILAFPGQTVCRNRLMVSVDGNDVGVALGRDRAGRELPSWQGCRRIPVGAVFLMNRLVPDSLDGRYFGPLTTDHIIGRAVPLWTDEQRDGHFEWRARAR